MEGTARLLIYRSRFLARGEWFTHLLLVYFWNYVPWKAVDVLAKSCFTIFVSIYICVCMFPHPSWWKRAYHSGVAEKDHKQAWRKNVNMQIFGGRRYFTGKFPRKVKNACLLSFEVLVKYSDRYPTQTFVIPTLPVIHYYTYFIIYLYGKNVMKVFEN